MHFYVSLVIVYVSDALTFLYIHPFFDGNGRIGRVLQTHMLQKFGFPPAFFLHFERDSYINALCSADDGNLHDWFLINLEGISQFFPELFM